MSDQEKPLARTFIVCGVVIERRNKYLLVQEKKPSVYGNWNLPGGRVDAGETLEQATIREAREECGLKITLERHLITLHQAVDMPVLHAYLASPTEGAVVFPNDEILDAQWFTYDQIMAMKTNLRNPDYIIGAIEASR